MMPTTHLPPTVPRRRTFSFQAMIAAGVWCSGCVFFENEYDSCFNDPTCASTETSLTGDGDSMSGAPGTGGEVHSGGDGDGDSAGAGDSSGGDGEGETMSAGGRTLGGGGEPGVGGQLIDAVG